VVLPANTRISLDKEIYWGNRKMKALLQTLWQSLITERYANESNLLRYKSMNRCFRRKFSGNIGTQESTATTSITTTATAVTTATTTTTTNIAGTVNSTTTITTVVASTTTTSTTTTS
jgi:hypothetical protein